MKKKFSELSKAEQEEIELWYHNMDPQEIFDILSRAKRQAGVKPRPKLSKKASRKSQSAPKPHASK
jgi:hypothetical protein